MQPMCFFFFSFQFETDTFLPLFHFTVSSDNDDPRAARTLFCNKNLPDKRAAQEPHKVVKSKYVQAINLWDEDYVEVMNLFHSIPVFSAGCEN